MALCRSRQDGCAGITLRPAPIRDVASEIRAGISGSTMARLNTNKYVSLAVIDKLCAVLGCQPGELLEYVADREK